MNAKPLPSCFLPVRTVEDGREEGGGAVYGSLVVINSFALLNERGRASVALIASRSARVNFRSSAVKTTLQILREAMQICLPPHQCGRGNVVRSVTGSLCFTQF